MPVAITIMDDCKDYNSWLLAIVLGYGDGLVMKMHFFVKQTYKNSYLSTVNVTCDHAYPFIHTYM
jgi:hypothetical protein